LKREPLFGTRCAAEKQQLRFVFVCARRAGPGTMAVKQHQNGDAQMKDEK
jgi:hypothetical protein